MNNFLQKFSDFSRESVCLRRREFEQSYNVGLLLRTALESGPQDLRDHAWIAGWYAGETKSKNWKVILIITQEKTNKYILLNIVTVSFNDS